MAVTRKRPLVLGSGSPYRRALLHRLGLRFEVIVPGTSEQRRADESPAATAHRLARDKARAVAGRAPASLVIGCDQVAEIDGLVLGKPRCRARNVEQLTLISGKRVSFRSAVCLLDAASGRMQVEVVDTTVAFRSLAVAEIEAYVDREPAFDCAGGFQVRGSRHRPRRVRSGRRSHRPRGPAPRCAHPDAPQRGREPALVNAPRMRGGRPVTSIRNPPAGGRERPRGYPRARQPRQARVGARPARSLRKAPVPRFGCSPRAGTAA